MTELFQRTRVWSSRLYAGAPGVAVLIAALGLAGVPSQAHAQAQCEVGYSDAMGFERDVDVSTDAFSALPGRTFYLPISVSAGCADVSANLRVPYYTVRWSPTGTPYASIFERPQPSRATGGPAAMAGMHIRRGVWEFTPEEIRAGQLAIPITLASAAPADQTFRVHLVYAVRWVIEAQTGADRAITHTIGAGANDTVTIRTNGELNYLMVSANSRVRPDAASDFGDNGMVARSRLIRVATTEPPRSLTVGAVTPAVAPEDTAVTFTVSIEPSSLAATPNPSDGGVGASWRIVGIGANPASAADFNPASGIVTIAGGETQATVSVGIRADGTDDTPEDYRVELTSPQRATLGTITQRDGRIMGDAGEPATDLSVSYTPVVDAGEDQDLPETGELVLDGSDSRPGPGDNEGILRYTWEQVNADHTAASVVMTTDGNYLGMIAADSMAPAMARVPVPDVMSPTTYYFRLMASATTLGVTYSSSDVVAVTINDVEPPVAEAGMDFDATENVTMRLSGSVSDPDGDGNLTVAWSQVESAPAVTFLAASSIASEVRWTGVATGSIASVTLMLTVTDSQGLRGTDTVSVTVRDDTAPVANAGADIRSFVGDIATLNGAGSVDSRGGGNTGQLSYLWQQVDSDSGAGAVVTDGLMLATPGSVSTTLMPPTVQTPTEYYFRLTVMDSQTRLSASDTVTLRVVPDQCEVRYSDAMSHTEIGTQDTVAFSVLPGRTFYLPISVSAACADISANLRVPYYVALWSPAGTPFSSVFEQPQPSRATGGPAAMAGMHARRGIWEFTPEEIRAGSLAIPITLASGAPADQTFRVHLVYAVQWVIEAQTGADRAMTHTIGAGVSDTVTIRTNGRIGEGFTVISGRVQPDADSDFGDDGMVARSRLIRVTATEPPRSLTVGAVTPAMALEGTAVTFTVSIEPPAPNPSDGVVGASWRIVGIGANPASPADFNPASGTVTIAGGETQATVSVGIRADGVDDTPEDYRVELTSPQRATLGTITQRNGRIVGATGEPVPDLSADYTPTADAGDNQDLPETDELVLDGSDSRPGTGDNEGILRYTWEQVNADSTTASVVMTTDTNYFGRISADSMAPAMARAPAPDVVSPTTYYFRLMASATTLGVTYSSSDVVAVTINDVEPPVAEAGTDFDVTENVTVRLSGSVSDPDDDENLTVMWSQMESAPAVTFVAVASTDSEVRWTGVAVGSTASVTLMLTVTDSQGLTSTDTVSVTVRDDTAPVANAGDDILSVVGDIATLNGAGSVDSRGGGNTGQLSYLWQQVDSDSGAGAVVTDGLMLATTGSVSTTLVSPTVLMPTEYHFRLTVMDSQTRLSSSDTVTLRVVPLQSVRVSDSRVLMVEGTTASVTIRLASAGATAEGNIGVDWELRAGGSTSVASASDFAAVTGMSVITTSSNSVTVILESVEDTSPEENESYTFILVGVSGAGVNLGSPASVSVTVTDDDEITVGFEEATYREREDVGQFEACVVITMPRQFEQMDRMFTLAVSTRPDSAGNADYTAIANQIVGPFSDLRRRECFSVEIANDTVPENSENFFLDLAPAPGEVLPRVTITPSEATVTIIDNDPIVIGWTQESLAVMAQERAGGSVVTLTAAINVPGTSGTIERSDFTIGLTTSGGTADNADYTPVSNMRIGPFGSTVRSLDIPITILDDNMIEAAETFTARLSFVPGEPVPPNTQINPAEATVTIQDDEMTPMPVISATCRCSFEGARMGCPAP